MLDALAKDAVDVAPLADVTLAAEPSSLEAPAPVEEADGLPSLRGLMARSSGAEAPEQMPAGLEAAPEAQLTTQPDEMLPPPAAPVQVHVHKEADAPLQAWPQREEETMTVMTEGVMDTGNDGPLERFATLTPRPRQRMAGITSTLALVTSVVALGGFLLVASGVRVQAAGVAATTPQFLTYVGYAAMAGGALGLLGLLWAMVTTRPGGVKRSMLAVLASAIVISSTVLAPAGTSNPPDPELAPDPAADRADVLAPPEATTAATAPSPAAAPAGIGKLICQIERNRARAAQAGDIDLTRFQMQAARAEAELAARADRTGIDSDPDFAASIGASFLGEPELRIEPAYPTDALAREMEGIVHLSVGFGRSGAVARAYVLAADPPEVFNTAAMDAVWAWTNRTHGDATNAPMQFVDVTIRFCLDQGNAEQVPVTN